MSGSSTDEEVREAADILRSAIYESECCGYAVLKTLNLDEARAILRAVEGRGACECDPTTMQDEPIRYCYACGKPVKEQEGE